MEAFLVALRLGVQEQGAGRSSFSGGHFSWLARDSISLSSRGHFSVSRWSSGMCMGARFSSLSCDIAHIDSGPTL